MTQPLLGNNNDIVVLDEWQILDRWWNPAEQIERYFIKVMWYGRKVMFVKEEPDTVWRLYNRKGAIRTWPNQSSKSSNE